VSPYKLSPNKNKSKKSGRGGGGGVKGVALGDAEEGGEILFEPDLSPENEVRVKAVEPRTCWHKKKMQVRLPSERALKSGV
jgi:hypothetical protein